MNGGTRCGFCVGEMRPAFTARDINHRCSGERFLYRRCMTCGSYSLANVPADLSSYYPPHYYALPRSRDEADRSTSGEEYKLTIVRRYVERGRLLEIGPGAGMFAHLASRRGFQVEVIEMSERTAAFLEKVLGIRVHRTSNEVATLKDCDRFDVIAMWHVIEHLRDPGALIAAAAARLNAGGILVVATPNPRALQFRMLGRRWVHVDAPRHVHLIAPGALDAVARRCQLTRVMLTSADEGALYWNVFGWELSLGRLFENTRLVSAAKRSGRVLARILSPLEAREGFGSAYTAVFRHDAA